MENEAGSVNKLKLLEIKLALHQLDKEKVDLDGMMVLPSQCYRLETDPPHILFNTNCPDSVRQKIEAILSNYTDTNEDRT